MFCVAQGPEGNLAKDPTKTCPSTPILNGLDDLLDHHEVCQILCQRTGLANHFRMQGISSPDKGFACTPAWLVGLVRPTALRGSQAAAVSRVACQCRLHCALGLTTVRTCSVFVAALVLG